MKPRISQMSKRTSAARATGWRQRGQAVIWLLGTMAASAAVLYGVFNVGQLHAAKEKTVNAADAAALAGATVEARMLNLIAYNNRSMMANEVLMGIAQHRVMARLLPQAVPKLGIVVLDFIPVLDVVGAFLTDSSQIASELQTGVGESDQRHHPSARGGEGGFCGGAHCAAHRWRSCRRERRDQCRRRQSKQFLDAYRCRAGGRQQRRRPRPDFHVERASVAGIHQAVHR